MNTYKQFIAGMLGLMLTVGVQAATDNPGHLGR
jgi:hypothetical protein